MRCAFSRDGIDFELQFCLTDGSTVFATNVHPIQVVISDALRNGLGDFDIFSDSRMMLLDIYSLVPRQGVVAEIIELVQCQIPIWLRIQQASRCADQICCISENALSADPSLLSSGQHGGCLVRHSLIGSAGGTCLATVG